MEIFNYLKQYFEFGSFGACSTFPQLLECMFNILLAVFIIVFFFKIMFSAIWRIGSGRL